MNRQQMMKSDEKRASLIRADYLLTQALQAIQQNCTEVAKDRIRSTQEILRGMRRDAEPLEAPAPTSARQWRPDPAGGLA